MPTAEEGARSAELEERLAKARLEAKEGSSVLTGFIGSPGSFFLRHKEQKSC
jgi:hypothetical protein